MFKSRSEGNLLICFVDCKLQYSAQMEHYRKAISIFEEMGFSEMEHPTLKYNAKNHFFQALLCHMCIDAVS